MAAARYPWGDVPAEVADLMRPQMDAVVPAIIAAVRDEVPEYDQPLEGEFGRFISEGVTQALEQFVGILGNDVPLENIGVYATLGRAEQRAGRTLDALQSAYRVGGRVAWREVAAFGEANDLDPAMMYRFAEAIFAYIDRLAAASVAGFTQAAADDAGSLQARRHALIELLLAEPAADPGDVERAAASAGWDVPARLAVVAVGDKDPVAIARRLPAGTIGAGLDPSGVLVVPDPDAPGRRKEMERGLSRARAVVGPAVRTADASVSARRAIAAWRLHDRGLLGDDAVTDADAHKLDLLLTADPRLTRDLVEARLRPLADMTELARERSVETLRAWLSAHGDVAVTAERLHVHPQTVRYRLGVLRESFGDALDDPDARVELALALRAQAAMAASSRSADGAADGAGDSTAASPPPGNA